MGRMTICKTTRIRDVLALIPGSEDILRSYGLHCVGCHVGGMETLAEGCSAHGFSTLDLEDLLRDLRLLLRKRHSLHPFVLTERAAHALRDIARHEERLGQDLFVGMDETGAFCLEFHPHSAEYDILFSHPKVPDLCVVTTTLMGERLRGATIDYREERFKLDFSENSSVQKKCCGGNLHPHGRKKSAS